MTQDEIIMCADASGISLYGMGKDREKFIHYLEAFANLVSKYEREACAKVCFEMWDRWMDADPSERDNLPRDAEDCASAIRARGLA